MKRFIYFLFCLVLSLSATLLIVQPINGQTAKRSSIALIIPGQSVGQIKIGDSLERVFQLYPRLKRGDYYEQQGCQLGEITLPDAVGVYLKNKRVVQISAASNYPKISAKTADKITAGSPAVQVKSRYPNANKTFTKLNSIAVSTGYAPLIYWVDTTAGIAFEFYTDQARGRLIEKIHVFAPGGQVKFGGACETDDDLRELPPFTTKVPEKMIKSYEDQLEK